MKCKNCGTKIKGNETVCPNCGAFVDEQSGYTVITEDRRYEDVYSSEQKRPRTGLRFFLIALLVIAIAAGGTFVYFKYLQPVQTTAPELTFTTGYGTINEGRKVIFIQPQGGKDMEYIHGVSLYNGKAEGEPLSTDYEYTKNVDGTFRTVFFYVDDMELDENATYSYTFVMTTSFVGSQLRFDYTQTVDFPGKIDEDVSATVFDHSMYERSENETTSEAETTAPATEQATTEATTAKQVSFDFAYEGYWYGAPSESGSKRSVDAFQFKSDGTYVITHYTQSGDSDWKTSTERGKFTAEGDTLSLTTESGVKLEIKADDSAKTLTLNGSEMAARKYNSTVNASDLFEED